MIYYLFYVPKVEQEREEKEKGVGEGGTGVEKLEHPTM